MFWAAIKWEWKPKEHVLVEAFSFSITAYLWKNGRNVGGYSCCSPAAVSPSCVTGVWEHVAFGMQTRQQNAFVC